MPFLLAILTCAAALALGLTNAYFSDAYLLLSLTLAVFVFNLFRLAFAPVFAPVRFFSLLYFVNFFTIPALFHTAYGRFPFFNASYPPSVITSAAVIVFLFSIVYSIFYTPRTPVTDGKKTTQTSLLDPPHFGLTVLALAIGTLIAGVMVGVDNFSITRGDLSRSALDRSPLQLILIAAANTGAYCAFYYSTLIFRNRPNFGSSISLFIFVLFFVYFNNPASIPRYVLFSYAIAFAVSTMNFTVALRVTTVVLAPFIQFTLFPLLSRIARGGAETDVLNYIASSGDFDGFQSVASIFAMTETWGTNGGRNILSALLFFVPRDIIPWKSPGTGIDAGNFMSFPYTNLSAPLPGELYVDFGWIGLVSLTAIFSRAVSAIDNAYARADDSPHSLGKLLPAVCAGYAFIVCRGSLISVPGPFVCSLLTFVVANSLVRRRPLSTTATSTKPLALEQASRGGSL